MNYILFRRLILIAGLSTVSMSSFKLNAAEKKATQAKMPAMPPALVLVDQTVQLDKEHARKYVGNMSAVTSINIVPRVTGFITKADFKKGSFVKKGDILFEIEDTEYIAKLQSAEAKVAQIEANLQYSEKQLERNITLQKSHAVAETTLDHAIRDVQLQKAQLKEAKAQLITAKNNLSYTKIYSPISGRVGAAALVAGNLVTPLSGKLTNVQGTDILQVRFAISEKTLRNFGGIKGFLENARVQLRLADGSMYPDIVKAYAVDNMVQSTTNTINIWARFNNPNEELIVGSFVDVMLTKESKEPIIGVLQSAVMFNDKGAFVYVVGKDNVVEARPIKVAGVTGKYQEVLSGLKANETVVVDGTHKVRPNGTVVPQPYKK